ncbi:MAG: hypothetical protein ACM3NR_02405 [Methanosarcina sp.]
MKTIKIFALSCILLFFTAKSSNAQGHELYDLDYWVFTIPCTGEFVWGTVSTECIRKGSDISHFIWNGELTCAETGNRFTFHGKINETSMFPAPGTTFTQEMHFTLMSKSGAKYSVHTNVHITFNSDGTMTASHDFEKVNCRE